MPGQRSARLSPGCWPSQAGRSSRARYWVWRGHWAWPDRLPRPSALPWPSSLPWPRLRRLPLRRRHAGRPVREHRAADGRAAAPSLLRSRRRQLAAACGRARRRRVHRRHRAGRAFAAVNDRSGQLDRADRRTVIGRLRAPTATARRPAPEPRQAAARAPLPRARQPRTPRARPARRPRRDARSRLGARRRAVRAPPLVLRRRPGHGGLRAYRDTVGPRPVPGLHERAHPGLPDAQRLADRPARRRRRPPARRPPLAVAPARRPPARRPPARRPPARSSTGSPTTGSTSTGSPTSTPSRPARLTRRPPLARLGGRIRGRTRRARHRRARRRAAPVSGRAAAEPARG